MFSPKFLLGSVSAGAVALGSGGGGFGYPSADCVTVSLPTVLPVIYSVMCPSEAISAVK